MATDAMVVEVDLVVPDVLVTVETSNLRGALPWVKWSQVVPSGPVPFVDLFGFRSSGGDCGSTWAG